MVKKVKKVKLKARSQDHAKLIGLVDESVAMVRTRSNDVSFNELFDMFKSQELIIQPDFQRLFRWSLDKQSQFIESLMLELPVPSIYVVEVDDGVYELIDGLQRISSYLHFRGLLGKDGEMVDDFLKLQGCDVLAALNGYTYNELPQALQIKLKRHFIRMEVLRRESDTKLRYHMFKRLNTGGELLSPQEIRNCTIRLLSPGFNDFLGRLSNLADYQICMSQLTEEKRKQMYLEEYVLRFFALKNNDRSYTKEIGDFLTSYMEDVSSGKLKFDYAEEEDAFQATFSVLAQTLGEGAFSGYNKQGNVMGYFSSLHFEAITLGIQPYLKRLGTAAARTKLKRVLEVAKQDPKFKKLTTGGGKNYAAALRERRAFIADKVGECLAK